MHDFWPLSVVLPKVPIANDWLIVLTLGGWLFLTLTLIFKKRYFLALLVGGIYIGLMPLFFGFEFGYQYPVKGWGEWEQTYWQDSFLVKNIRVFLKDYDKLQPELSYHARVHPPGAVLWFWALRKGLVYPELVAVALFLMSYSSVLSLYGFLTKKVGAKAAVMTSTLMAVSPQMAVYGLASLDGVIMALTTFWLIRVLLCFEQKGSRMIVVGLMVLISGMTFAIVWHWWLLGWMGLIYKKWQVVRRILIDYGLVMLFLGILFKFSYWQSFVTAASFEGFVKIKLWQQPIIWTVTRLEGILEPIVFLGPVLGYFIWQSIRTNIKAKYSLISLLGLSGFGVFLGFGAYYTGETARAAWYICPPLFMTLATYLKRKPISLGQFGLYVLLVAGQGVLMNLIGFWSW